MSSNGVTRDTRSSDESEAPGIERRLDPRERPSEAPNGGTTGSGANGSIDADGDGADAAGRHARARRALDRHAATVERLTLRRALRRLDDQGGISPAQRAVLERFVERLGDGVLAGPRATLAADGDATRPDGGDEGGGGTGDCRVPTTAVVERLFDRRATGSEEKSGE